MREKVLDILSEVCPGVDFDIETALVDDGIIESLEIVTIVTELMAEFDVEIDVLDLLPENFNSVDAIIELIQGR